MQDTDIGNKENDINKEIKKLRMQAKLNKSLSMELERQKLSAVEARELAQNKTNELSAMIKKLKMESQLRKNLSAEFERQKEIAIEAEKTALQRKSEIEKISNQLSKYLSPQIYQAIFSGEQEVDIVSRRKKLTVFFCDIVGFTSITDSLESEEITSMLNYYLTEMSNIALEFGGTIDKYIGDAILIFFGDPKTTGVKSDALKCVNMAVSMQRKMRRIEDQWAQRFGLKDPLQMRVGINTGYCTVGNFGSDNRLDYTVIGAPINLASRLESIAKPGSILISFDTYSQVSENIQCIEQETVSVKGISEKVRTYEVDLGIPNKENVLKTETNNLRCSIDVNEISVEEIEKLLRFVKSAKRTVMAKVK